MWHVRCGSWSQWSVVQVIVKDAAGAATLLTTVGVGSVFGEMSLLSEQRPSATVIAREVSEAFNMSVAAFASIKPPRRFKQNHWSHQTLANEMA